MNQDAEVTIKAKDISQAKNADLRGSWPALQRAAQRARELAALTGTELVIGRGGGSIERIRPQPNAASSQAAGRVVRHADKG